MLNQCCNYLPCYFDAFFCPESKRSKRVNPFQPIVAFHIETSHLFCSARQMTSFYMKRKTGLNGLITLSFPLVIKQKLLIQFRLSSTLHQKLFQRLLYSASGNFMETVQMPQYFLRCCKSHDISEALQNDVKNLGPIFLFISTVNEGVHGILCLYCDP